MCLVGSVCIRSALWCGGTVCMCLVGSSIHSPPLKEIPQNPLICQVINVCLMGNVCIRSDLCGVTVCLVGSSMHSLPPKETTCNRNCTVSLGMCLLGKVCIWYALCGRTVYVCLPSGEFQAISPPQDRIHFLWRKCIPTQSVLRVHSCGGTVYVSSSKFNAFSSPEGNASKHRGYYVSAHACVSSGECVH